MISRRYGTYARADIPVVGYSAQDSAQDSAQQAVGFPSLVVHMPVDDPVITSTPYLPYGTRYEKLIRCRLQAAGSRQDGGEREASTWPQRLG
jgi:hypothetical protein